jgi:hypothetical protein
MHLSRLLSKEGDIQYNNSQHNDSQNNIKITTRTKMTLSIGKLTILTSVLRVLSIMMLTIMTQHNK